MSHIRELAQYLFASKLIDSQELQDACDNETALVLDTRDVHETSTSLRQAAEVIGALGASGRTLLLGQPGLGKSAIVAAIAHATKRTCRTVVVSQIMPEDILGLPGRVGERTAYFPPRTLLPERDEPAILFLDELTGASPDVQKALYPLILDRRIGEYALHPDTWIVAAGNRSGDQAQVRGLSSALLNRVTVFDVRADVTEWLAWAAHSNIRGDIRAFITLHPAALVSEPGPRPFSTPRSWSALSSHLDRLRPELWMQAAIGTISREHAELFLAGSERLVPADVLDDPGLLPHDSVERWATLRAIRDAIAARMLRTGSAKANAFLLGLSLEERAAVLTGLVSMWGRLGANAALKRSLKELVA